MGPPPTPPPVTTSLLLLRGIVAGITGAPLSTPENTPSNLQPTYLKEKPSLTGKFSFPLGKRQGTACELTVGATDGGADGDDALLDAIQTAADRIVAEDIPIVVTSATRSEVTERYGPGVFDASQKKGKKGVDPDADVVCVAYVQGVVAGVCYGDVLKSTGLCGKIEVKRGNLASGVVCGKKARKCEVTIKFEVIPPTDRDLELGVVSCNGFDNGLIEPLMQKKVRMVEGLAMLRKQQEAAAQAEAEAQAALASAKEEKESAGDVSKEAKKDNGDDSEEMVVDPFEVKGKIDYNKLISSFGSQRLTEDLLDRLLRLCKSRSTVSKLHHFLTRGIFFSHRDFDKIVTCLENKQPMYLYTGRGPSSAAMHMGHLVPFLFTKWLQKAFDCPLVIQMTDDEKFIFKGEYSPETGDNLKHFHNLTTQNAKDIIALGFDKSKTFIFSDLDYVGTMYPNIVRIWKACTTNSISSLFGFDGTSNAGKIAFPAIQAAPSFSSSFPVVLNREANLACLIPCAIDQDPYFRMTRDIAHKLVPKTHPLAGKPALIHSQFFPPLQGAQGKMSSSDLNSAIFLTDSPEDIERKIKEYAFSGGRETKKEQEMYGANLEADVSFQWLKFFLESDEELACIERDYGTGSGQYWSTAKVKAKLITVVKDIVGDHQKRRELVTDDVVKEWMTERKLE
mmetsp:Transcript_30584/g.37340  ORF Transcript_30584/g.37340 Transcript_30584/m.37340 type:complete len:678 (+) Transcript_30584:134-2167(+)|eukprot:CAMPEP_0172506440 /NCGR_PEP_ID=MMETSP1066-20121228/195104_1 /TAXON_ID=671091 /ORGANISM="Coscinodiscus wailesii, Strain CCMP2513" /LENGTH=677 /DNA_ID=CAMNT_0013283475 /DNA_START=127 /DNA_END=2160 /DNA_ORIENTATION=-